MAHTLWASERLVYRGVDPEDEDFLARINADPDAYLNSAPLLPIVQNKKSIKNFLDFLMSDHFLLAAIICIPSAKESNGEDERAVKPTPIGFITLDTSDARFQHHRRSGIGINILRAYQGKGYGGEAIQWSLRWGFKRANLHRVSIGAFSYNKGALKLYEKLGFVREAVRREFLWHDGEWHDLVELAILDREWRELYDGKRLESEVVKGNGL